MWKMCVFWHREREAGIRDDSRCAVTSCISASAAQPITNTVTNCRSCPENYTHVRKPPAACAVIVPKLVQDHDSVARLPDKLSLPPPLLSLMIFFWFRITLPISMLSEVSYIILLGVYSSGRISFSVRLPLLCMQILSINESSLATILWSPVYFGY